MNLQNHYFATNLPTYDVTREEMDTCRREMSGEYNNPDICVNYADQVTHCAYIRSDVTLRVNVIAWTFKNHVMPVMESLLYTTETLNIVSIGCGPGTDMIGILKQISELSPSNPPSLRFQFHLLDSQLGWVKAVNLFDKYIRQHYAPTTLTFSQQFYQWDITKTPQNGDLWQNDPLQVGVFEQAHIFIFSMVFSDLLKIGGDQERVNVKINVDNLIHSCGCNSLFLIIDVDGYNVDQNMGSIFPINHPQLKLIHHQHDINYSLPTWEEKTDLGTFFSRDWYPNLGAKIIIFVYQKIEETTEDPSHQATPDDPPDVGADYNKELITEN